MSLAQSKRTMLVIDDDRAILRSFSRIFEKKGYFVSTAETGKEAQEKLSKQTYDATLVDIKLSDMNGADLLPFMREIAPNMVKIVISGLPSVEIAYQAAVNGADAFLSKPVHPEILFEVLDKKLKEKRF
jgi:DNA-binding NtrC family response regulator